jgi:hypothetical protein
MFNITGCTPATDIEPSTQGEIVSSVTENETQEPNKPREDLEVEVAPGVTSN